MENGELNVILSMASKLYEMEKIEAFVEIGISEDESVVLAAVVGGKFKPISYSLIGDMEIQQMTQQELVDLYYEMVGNND